jgi:ABC-type phosphate transport system ATPase subunit
MKYKTLSKHRNNKTAHLIILHENNKKLHPISITINVELIRTLKQKYNRHWVAHRMMDIIICIYQSIPSADDKG